MPRPAFALIALLFPVVLSAGRIDFEEFSPVALPLDQSMIESAGFRVSLVTAGGLSLVPLTSFCPTGCVSNGTATLAAMNGSVLELTTVSGALFDFSAFDVAGTFSASLANIETLIVEGEFSNGSTISTGFTVIDPEVFTTYSLNGFTSLRAVRFLPLFAQDPACTGCPEYQLDNLEVALAAVTPPPASTPVPSGPTVPVTIVPEPSAFSLILGAVGAWAWVRRRSASI